MLLDLEQPLQLATDRLHKVCNDTTRVKEVLENTMFKVAIADAGGLPGAVIWACDGATHDYLFRQSSFIEALTETARGYAKFPLPDRWKACVLCSFACSPLVDGSILVARDPNKGALSDWTVSRAADSGSILVLQGQDEDAKDSREIRVAPCFL